LLNINIPLCMKERMKWFFVLKTDNPRYFFSVYKGPKVETKTYTAYTSRKCKDEEETGFTIDQELKKMLLKLVHLRNLSMQAAEEREQMKKEKEQEKREKEEERKDKEQEKREKEQNKKEKEQDKKYKEKKKREENKIKDQEKKKRAGERRKKANFLNFAIHSKKPVKAKVCLRSTISVFFEPKVSKGLFGNYNIQLVCYT